MRMLSNRQSARGTELTDQEEKEGFVVGMPNTVVDPWAMVILQFCHGQTR